MKFRSLHVGAIVCLAPLLSFSNTAAAASFATVYTFKGPPTDGTAYGTDLIYENGLFYGASPTGGPGSCKKRKDACGVIFSLDPASGTESVLYSFTKARVGKSLDGHLAFSAGHVYGTTLEGGRNSLGIVFDLDLHTDRFKVLHTFAGYPTDAGLPSGPLLVLKGNLYGTGQEGTIYSDTGCCGALYKINIATGVESVVYSFKGGSDGANPRGGVIYENGLLYGVTAQGGGAGCAGAVGCGTIYSIDPETGVETVLHSFGQGSDGTDPNSPMTYGGGLLYGETVYGGSRQACGNSTGCGTIFSFDPSSQVEAVLYNFGTGSLGYYVHTRLVYSDGTLYGTSVEDKNADALIFSVSLSNNNVKKLLTFPPGGGASDLVLAGSDLYGAWNGGSAYGLVFSTTP